MNNKEINEAIARLTKASWELEDAYIENGGECTEETAAMEEAMEAISELLSHDGIDSLGRWMKSEEDLKKTLKTEKDYLTRKMAAIDSTMEYIKYQVSRIMDATGIEKIKGALGYSFTATESRTVSVDKDALKAFYEDRIQEALTAARIPVYITFTLGASSTKAEKYGLVDGDEELFITTVKPTVKFMKPRAKRNDDVDSVPEM